MFGSRGGGGLKLIGTLRGAGVLKVGEASIEVSYHLDRFQSRMGQTASGEIDGALEALVDAEDAGAATLVLQNGSELSVLLSNVEATGANVEARGAVLDQ